MIKNQTPSYEEYREILLKNCKNNFFTSEKFYNTYMNGLVSQVKGERFSEILRILSSFEERYIQPKMLFLENPEDVTLTYKPADSIINKIYRLNIIRKKKKDQQDITLDNFTENIDDIFRTRFICKYMDGPKFVCESLKKFCDSLSIECNYRDITTDLGYHAWHFYYKQPIEDFLGEGQANIYVELQFTTQLAEVIGSLTHIQYEAARLGEKPAPGWRWDVNSKQFRPFYIGHGLHLLEGVILEFRNSVLSTQNAMDPTDIQANEAE